MRDDVQAVYEEAQARLACAERAKTRRYQADRVVDTRILVTPALLCELLTLEKCDGEWYTRHITIGNQHTPSRSLSHDVQQFVDDHPELRHDAKVLPVEAAFLVERINDIMVREEETQPNPHGETFDDYSPTGRVTTSEPNVQELDDLPEVLRPLQDVLRRTQLYPAYKSEWSVPADVLLRVNEHRLLCTSAQFLLASDTRLLLHVDLVDKRHEAFIKHCEGCLCNIELRRIHRSYIKDDVITLVGRLRPSCTSNLWFDIEPYEAWVVYANEEKA